MGAKAATYLREPPKFYGNVGAWAAEMYKWAYDNNLRLNTALGDALQRLNNIAGLAALTQTISSPPTQAQVTALQTALNAILTEAKTTITTFTENTG